MERARVSKPWHRDVPKRVTEYLSAGGLFNPELMDHEAVRDILIDARDVIEIIARERAGKETRPAHGGLTTCDMDEDETF